MKIEMVTSHDPITDSIVIVLKIPQTMTRTDGEFKWRLVQAITLALTEKESRYAGADTPEGLERLLALK